MWKPARCSKCGPGVNNYPAQHSIVLLNLFYITIQVFHAQKKSKRVVGQVVSVSKLRVAWPIQRVLNDLYRTRLSCRRMIWLPPPPSPSKLSLFCLPVCRRWSSLLTEVGGGRDGGQAWSSIDHLLLSEPTYLHFHSQMDTRLFCPF
jgi:hypothetical protein